MKSCSQRQAILPDHSRLLRFYLRESLARCGQAWLDSCSGGTNYEALLDEIRGSGQTDVALVTFNYDALLEHALSYLAGGLPRDVDAYMHLERFALFKVHGSVTWGRHLQDNSLTPASESPAEYLIRRAHNLVFSDNFVYIGHDRGFQWQNKNHVLIFPSIAIPTQTKVTFECPPTHLEELKRRLPSVTRVLIIGWRGLDKHFVSLLRDTMSPNVPMQLVCGTEEFGHETVQNLLQQGLTFAPQTLPCSFSEYVTSRVGREFLRN